MDAFFDLYAPWEEINGSPNNNPTSRDDLTWHIDLAEWA